MKGFVTLAVGDEKYYKLAANLLKSYKFHTKNKMPFAIVADHHNKYTKEFDDVYIMSSPTFTYMDKIEMLKICPYEDNIFIDSDCLAYGDLNKLWNYYSSIEHSGGVTCFGKTLPVDSTDGWFKIDDICEYKNKVSFSLDTHGGIVFFKRGALTDMIYEQCVIISDNYSKFKFKYFNQPADEPIIALSMAMNNCHPIDVNETFIGEHVFLFYPTADRVKCNIKSGKLDYYKQGQFIQNTILLHWQNSFTEIPKYMCEVDRLRGMGYALYPWHLLRSYFKKFQKVLKRKLQ